MTISRNGGRDSGETHDNYIRVAENGLFSIAFVPCRCSVLRQVLDRSVPYVCIQSHSPDEKVEWFGCSLPLRKNGTSRSVEVRNVVFDLRLTTEGFLSVLDDFEELGIDLYQSNDPLPGTLAIDKLFAKGRVDVLRQNGFHARFYLPHPCEVAVYWSVNRNHLEEVVDNREMRSKLIAQDEQKSEP